MLPGIDRTLVILQGTGLRLRAEGGTPFEIMPETEPTSFPADVLPGGYLLKVSLIYFSILSVFRIYTIFHGRRILRIYL